MNKTWFTHLIEVLGKIGDGLCLLIEKAASLTSEVAGLIFKIMTGACLLGGALGSIENWHLLGACSLLGWLAANLAGTAAGNDTKSSNPWLLAGAVILILLQR
jgi:hypothetical protein